MNDKLYTQARIHAIDCIDAIERRFGGTIEAVKAPSITAQAESVIEQLETARNVLQGATWLKLIAPVQQQKNFLRLFITLSDGFLAARQIEQILIK